MLQVTKIEPQKVEHFNPDNVSLGYLNEYESNDLRIQVAKNKLDGYYLLFNNEKVNIQSNGKIENWPFGLYDTIERQLAELFKNQS